MRALVTGSTGFIGRHLVKQLLQSSNWEVHCIARRDVDTTKVRVHKVDLTDYAAVSELFDSFQFDVVFHCAATVKIGNRGSDDMVSDNFDMTHFIVCSMLKHGGLLVHLSSIAALGVDNISKCSHYGRSKFLCENEVFRGISMGLKAVVVRPSVVVGVGGQIERVLRFIRRWGWFYTSGGTGFVDVADVVKVMEMLASEEKCVGKGWTVNGWNLSFKDFVRTFGGRPVVRVADWMVGSMMSGKRSYDGGEVVDVLDGKFEYTPLSECAIRIKDEL